MYAEKVLKYRPTAIDMLTHCMLADCPCPKSRNNTVRKVYSRDGDISIVHIECLPRYTCPKCKLSLAEKGFCELVCENGSLRHDICDPILCVLCKDSVDVVNMVPTANGDVVCFECIIADTAQEAIRRELLQLINRNANTGYCYVKVQKPSMKDEQWLQNLGYRTEHINDNEMTITWAIKKR